MPNPKKRHSRCKTGSRRSHDFLTKPALSLCPECGEPKRPHNVCPSCGVYKGRTVVKKEETL
ncbi:MAG: 50S ribosomal protein L32 [Thermodesulfobacteriota bacterium]|nr:MAG: 50S ribosomal protein L32 [Thermodesulfobacteriota bacterium]